jgi:superfamily II DNA or RNA helicase
MLMRFHLLSDRKGLIIVPKVQLVEQLFSDFEEYSELNGWKVEDHIHRIYSGKEKDNPDTKVYISTWQSLFEMPKKYFEKFEFVVNDEVHLSQAKSLTYILSNLTNATERIGLTGTLSDSKTHELVIKGLFGPVQKVISTKELMDKNLVADFKIKCLLLKHPEISCKLAKDFSFQEEMEYLVQNPERNSFIANLAISLKGNTLVLFQYVEKHGKILYEIIKNKASNRKVFLIYGNTDVEIREQIRQIVEKETDAIIVASFGTTSTGTNIKNLHNVIFASPSKSRIRNLQSIGRALRISDTKTSATLYDIADDLKYKKYRDNYTLKHFEIRIQTYAEEKFDFKIFKLDLAKG